MPSVRATIARGGWRVLPSAWAIAPPRFGPFTGRFRALDRGTVDQFGGLIKHEGLDGQAGGFQPGEEPVAEETISFVITGIAFFDDGHALALIHQHSTERARRLGVHS
jgi:hypothetical protein